VSAKGRGLRSRPYIFHDVVFDQEQRDQYFYRIAYRKQEEDPVFSATMELLSPLPSDKLSFFSYPNPAQDSLDIHLRGRGAGVNLEIKDQEGRVYWQEGMPHHRAGINVSTWPRGIYDVICYEGKQVMAKKLILE